MSRINDPFYGELDTKCGTIPIVCFVTLPMGISLRPLSSIVWPFMIGQSLFWALEKGKKAHALGKPVI